MEVVGETGNIDNDITNVLNKWKQDFSSLLNPNDGNSPTCRDYYINNQISDPFLDSPKQSINQTEGNSGRGLIS